MQRTAKSRYFLTLLAAVVAVTAWGFAPSSVVAQTYVPAGWQPWVNGNAGAMLPSTGTLLRASVTGGDGVGHESSYVTLGFMQPYFVTDTKMLYFDAQGLIYTDTYLPDSEVTGGGNFGIGFREPSPLHNGLWGLSVWYDIAEQRRFSYQQVGLSIESLGIDWDMRANVYIPVGDSRNLVSLTDYYGPVFRNFNMYLLQTRWEERAYKGADLEIGRRILGEPFGPHLNLYGGFYAYDSDGPSGYTFSGGRARLMAQLLPDLQLHLAVSHDSQYETNVTAGATWWFPVGRAKNCCTTACCTPFSSGYSGPSMGSGTPTEAGPPPPESMPRGVEGPVSSRPTRPSGVPATARQPRLYSPVVRGQYDCFPYWRYFEPVMRNPNIVVRDVIYEVSTVVTDPITGQPITIIHVDSNATQPGNGSVEFPFQTLAEAEAAAATGQYDIVFAHADSVFTGEQITLPPDVRFLGEGIDHYVDSAEAGTILLPRATDGTDLPIIDQAPGNAVTVASGDEVSGFTITDPAAAGIFAQNVDGPVDINRNTIVGGVNGINILDSTGTFTVTETSISDTTGTAFNINGGAPTVISSADINNTQGRMIAVVNTSGGSVTFQGGTLLDEGGDGILIQDANAPVLIDGGTLNNSTGNAVDVLTSDGPITLNNLVIFTPTIDGVDVVDSNLTATGLNINNAMVNGIEVTNLNNDRTVSLTGNTIANVGQTGIQLNVDGTGTLNATVANNTIHAKGSAFDAATSGAGGDLILAFNNNSLTSVNGSGAVIDGTAGGTVTITSFANNTVVDAAQGGVLIYDATFDANSVIMGLQPVNGGTLTIGSSGNRVTGPGLVLDDVDGTLALTTLDIFNEQGTGLTIDGTSPFAFQTTGGTIDTANGSAMQAQDVTLGMTVGTIKSTNSPTEGVHLDAVAGSMTSGTTTITQPTNDGILVENSPGLVANFGATTVTGAGVAGGAVGDAVNLTNNPGGLFTFSSLNASSDNGSGFVAINSGTVNFLSPATVTANFGPAVIIQDTNGQTNGAPGWSFASLTSNNSPTVGIYLNDLADPFTVSGATNINAAAGTSILIDGQTNASFAQTTITNRGGAGIDLNNTSGVVSFGATSISGAGAGTAGVDYSDSTAGSLTFASLSVSGSGGPSVNLVNNAGAFAVTGATTINASQGTGIAITGGTGGATFNAVTMTNRFGTGIDIAGGNQLINFGATSINNPNLVSSPAVEITDMTGGSVNFSSLAIDNNNAVADGLSIANNDGTINVLAGSITRSGNAAVRVSGGLGDINLASTITNTAGRTIDIFGREGGTITFSGAINDSGTGSGIRIDSPVAANVVQFTAPVTLGTTANRLTGDTALFVDNGGLPAGDAVVSFADLRIATMGDIGIDARDGGTLNIQTGTIDTTGTGAIGLRLANIESLITLTSLAVDNIGGAASAVDFTNVTGQFNVTSPTTIGNTGPVGRGLSVVGGDVDITMAGLTVKNRQLEGIFVDGTGGDMNFGAVSIMGPGSAGVAAVDIRNTFDGSAQFDSLSVTGGQGRGIALTNNVANFVVAGATVVNSALDGIQISGGAPPYSGNVTFNSIDVTNGQGAGFQATNVSGLVTVASGKINTSNGLALDVDNSLIDITLDSITATNSGAIDLTGNSIGTLTVNGLVKVSGSSIPSVNVIGGNVDVHLTDVDIANVGGVGLRVDNTAGLVQIDSGKIKNTNGTAVDIQDATLAVNLTSVAAVGGPYGLRLADTAGSFTVTGAGAAGTGGVIQAGTNGIVLDNAENVSLAYMTVSDVANTGVQMFNGTSNVTLNNISVGTVGTIGIHANQVSGLTMLDNSVTTASATNPAVLLEQGDTALIQGGQFTSPAAAIQVVDNDNVTIKGTNISGVGAGDGIVVINGNNSNINGNTILNTNLGILVASNGQNIVTRIEANTIDRTVVGIAIDGLGGGSVHLNAGVIIPPPNPTVDNTVTNFLFDDFATSGVVTGKIQVNGVAVP